MSWDFNEWGDWRKMDSEYAELRAGIRFVCCGYECGYFPDQDVDHPGIQYPECQGNGDTDNCWVADYLGKVS